MSLFTINPKLCQRDGICVEECPPGIIEMGKKKGFPFSVEKAEETCIRCGPRSHRVKKGVHILLLIHREG